MQKLNINQGVKNFESYTQYKDFFIIGALVFYLLINPSCSNSTSKEKNPPNPITREGWTLDFNDEFNGTELDTSKWLPYYFPHSTTRERAAAQYNFKEGALILRIDENTPQYKSDWNMKVSSIQTYEKNFLHQKQQENDEFFEGYATKYGYFEMRAKLPKCGGGGHIAWWMIGCQEQPGVDYKSNNDAEIDVMEQLFNDTKSWEIKLHKWSDNNLKEQVGGPGMFYTITDNNTEEYHIYAMEWDPNGMRFYYDNQIVGQTNQSPGYRMMTLIGLYEDCGWDGKPNDNYPKELSIDYFRVYKKNEGYNESRYFMKTGYLQPKYVSQRFNNEKIDTSTEVSLRLMTQFYRSDTCSVTKMVNKTEIANSDTFDTSKDVKGKTKTQIYIDEEGVMRWEDNDEDVRLFGVNYLVPFSFGYRAIKDYLKLNNTDVIDQDVSHMARMGLDLLRIHLFDCEISNLNGDVLENDHLKLLDYLISKVQARGIKTILTLMSYWGSGFPEYNYQTPGFANIYSKQEMASNPDAIKAQKNYLIQILNHVNNYTGLSYKDDPSIIAFEINNEPEDIASDTLVTRYINDLAKTIRNTGCTKPIFYNISQGSYPGLVMGAINSIVDGVTFAWYPFGLVNNHSLGGNYLPQVDEYPLNNKNYMLKGKVKILYEFDAADVPGSYIYPAIARTFRSTGMQCAPMFTYDPLPLANTNTDYKTHYLNLVYSPNRAMSFIIASEAFHRLPPNKYFGTYPANAKFEEFFVSYENDLSEMVTETDFMYSNNTNTTPPSLQDLKLIAGCGSSKVVKYEGTGCYFLEKLEAGIWRLEVYPDAVWVNDPFEYAYMDKEVSRVLWRQWPMEINLPDLGFDFNVTPLNNTNTFTTYSKNGIFDIRPGVYLVTKKGRNSSEYSAITPFNNLLMGEFYAQPEVKNTIVVIHKLPEEIILGESHIVTAKIVSSEMPDKVILHVRTNGGKRIQHLEMCHQKNFEYAAIIPSEWIQLGKLEYTITTQLGNDIRTFPADLPGDLSIPSQEPLLILDPKSGCSTPDIEILNSPDKTASVNILTDSVNKKVKLRMDIPGLDLHNDITSIGISIDSGRIPADCNGEQAALIFTARSLYPDIHYVEIALIERDRKFTYLYNLPLTETWRKWRVPLRSFTIPFKTNTASRVLRMVNLHNVDSIRFTFSNWFSGSSPEKSYGMEIQSIGLESLNMSWKVPVIGKDSPLIIFDAERDRDNLTFFDGGDASLQQGKIAHNFAEGITPGKLALWFWKNKKLWEGDPDIFSLRIVSSKPLGLRNNNINLFNTLVLRVRAAEKTTDSLEVALIGQDGSSWGKIIKINNNWSEIRIPLNELQPISLSYTPRGYPYSNHKQNQDKRILTAHDLDLRKIEALQISFGPYLNLEAGNQPHAIELESISLEITN